ncbi:hypothetical protein TBLA_0E01480 [Henningerozyma blattae CBS 6284]|uniref:GPI ethanolamine phosphate transferase 3 n=1 Tax=Henningerozyma blattae (strain ATCC 34711 / CBS 6284 / DSM 70876 / NBRC 10599 / NRRL Y-10934 / UCD 77-7) TaxID=1071380 RepID=I2H4A4_HENB6|nr:hypothetical protein TBLA_0E01480 [Tetrapisispora blattae CBS 6284]CCH61206.1 hypothetical protein TBLA_0E01480 [Tetrapisispora blattae CBS 6284]
MDEWKVKKSILATSIEEKRLYRSRIRKFRKTHGFYVILLISLLVLQFIALAFFTRGFLLTRPVYDDVSIIPTLNTEDEAFNINSKFKKTMLIIISGISFDNLIPIPEESINYNESYHNNLNVLYNNFNQSLQNTSNEESSSSLLIKLKTYPPTDTLQRVKCITGGSVPSFIDTGITFYGSMIEEDNILKQMYLNNRSIYFTGDKFWNSLYSKYFQNFKLANNIDDIIDYFQKITTSTNHSYGESNRSSDKPISLDTNLLQNISSIPTISNATVTTPSKDWDILIGHIMEDTMNEKVTQLKVNSFLNDTINSIDNDTLLLVLGDYSTANNHMLDTGLFMYTKKFKNFWNLQNHLGEYNVDNFGENYRVIDQFDVVPSLSLLLGLPIPFNNLGWPIDEIISPINSNLNDVRTLWYNSTLSQLKHYKDKTTISKSRSKNAILQKLWLKAIENPIENGEIYQKSLLKMCQKKWTQFDNLSIVIGIVLLFISLILLIFITKMIPSILVSQMVTEFVHCIGRWVLICNFFINILFYIVKKPTNYEYIIWCALFATGVGITIGSTIPIFQRYNWSWIYGRLFEDPYDYWTNIGLMFLLTHCLVFASNSFIIWEDRITSFLLTTFGFISLYEFTFIPRRTNTSALFTAVISEQQGTSSGVNPSKANSYSLPPTRFARLLGGYHSIVLILCTRIGSSITACRPEQGDYCIPTFTSDSNFSGWSMGLCFLAVLFIPLCVKGYYNLTSSYQAAAPIWIDVFLKGLLLGNFIYWSLVAIERHNIVLPWDLSIAKQVLARMLSGFALVVCNLGWALGPLCIKLNTRNSDVRSQQTTILGYSNIYGAPFFLLVLNALMIIMFFSKPLSQVSYALMCNQLLSLLEIIDLLKLKENIIAPLTLGLLAYQQFFTTGHEATVMSIQWDISHILSDTESLPLTSLTLIINTFGPFILVALSVALITLWQQPPDVLKPLTILGRIVSNCGTLLIYNTILCLSSVILVIYFKGHDLEWEVFCPRYLMAASCLVVIQIVVTFGTIAFATGRLITHINDIFWK